MKPFDSTQCYGDYLRKKNDADIMGVFTIANKLRYLSPC